MIDDYDEDEVAELKTKYAKALLNNKQNPLDAALSVVGENTGFALWIARFWQNDEFVLSEMRRVTNDESEQDSVLPTKAELCLKIYERMSSPGTAAEDFARLAKLYADVRGFIEKPQNNTTVNLQQNKVMIVRDHGNDDEWGEALKAQQRKLISDNAERH